MTASSLEQNSLVLVTGAGGYLGSAIVIELLKQGFRVRGTTRTSSKLDLLKQKADKLYGPGRFEATEVADLAVRGALDQALKGVQGVINVASDTSFGDNLQIVKDVISLTNEVLSSVKAAGTVKSFVSTSSRIAAFNADGSKPFRVNDGDWFDEAYRLAENCQTAEKAMFVYAASKVEGERAVWKFVEQQKPDFRVNAILPDLVMGKIQNPAAGNYSTGSALLDFADGKHGLLEFVFTSPAWFVDVEDTAKLHVAALLDESVDGKRLWAASAPYSAAAISEAIKATKPSFQEQDLSQYPGFPDIVIDNKASIALLQKHHKHGFKTLKESIKSSLE